MGVPPEQIVNPLMRRFLGSRFHRLAGTSDTLMILTFRGRRSGKTYSFPTGYLQDGRQLVSYAPFRWWVNLRGGAPVTVTPRGQKLQSSAEVCTEPAIVAAGMDVYLRHNPGDAMFWKVRVDQGEGAQCRGHRAGGADQCSAAHHLGRRSPLTT